MRWLFSATLIWLLAISVPCAADASLVDATPREGDIFILTAALTLRYANAQLLLEAKQPIFCEPAHSPYTTADQLWRLAGREVTGQIEPDLAVVALMSALRAEYPC